MAKKNCWDYLGCNKKGSPAHGETRLYEVHGGHNAGRACWAVAGTGCGGKVQGEYAQKIGNCMKCYFYLMVAREEGALGLTNGLRLLEMLQSTVYLDAIPMNIPGACHTPFRDVSA